MDDPVAGGTPRTILPPAIVATGTMSLISGGGGEVVAVEDQQVGEHARPERAQMVLAKHQERVAPGVGDEGLLAGEDRVLALLAAQRPAGHRPPQGDESVDLGGARPVGALSPADTYRASEQTRSKHRCQEV
jgi:hypothetical protein